MKELMGKRAAILTLGCKVNQYESDSMAEALVKQGCLLVDFDQEADIYLVNTCSVTHMAQRKSRQMLHRAKKLNKQSIVVAVGCYVQNAPEELLADLAVDIVLGNDCKSQLIDHILAYMTNQESSVATVGDINQVQEYDELGITKRREHTRGYIKIQDGCNQFCSYCIIPYVRGRIRSRKPEDILREVQALIQDGCKEIVLTGIHISSYGRDMQGTVNTSMTREMEDYQQNNQLFGEALLSLIDELNALPGLERIRIGSLEPRIITEKFVKRLVQADKVCPHFHLSLQSACDETLKRMNRHYTVADYWHSLELLRSYYDRPAITTDVIVGFPGETDEEFEETCQALQEMKLYEMHVFKYSRREGTVAANMENQVPEPIKASRSERLLALTAKQKAEYEASFDQELVGVLIEEEMATQPGTYVGHTSRYMKIKVKAQENLVNQVVDVIYQGNEEILAQIPE